MIYSFFSNAFYYSGLSWILKQMKINQGKYVLMFHGVSKNRVPKYPKEIQPDLDSKQFEKILLWLRNRFEILSPDEILTTEKHGVLLTFDDGFKNNFTNVLPILEKHLTPGLFFISTQHIKDSKDLLCFLKSQLEELGIDEYSLPKELQDDFLLGLSKYELYEMSRNSLVTIGSHSISHPLLSKCDDLKIKNELNDSKIFLENLIKRKVKYFAYPYGDYNQEVMKYVKEAGYDAAFATDITNNLGNLKYEIPRIGLYSESIPYLAAKLSGIYQKPLLNIK